MLLGQRLKGDSCVISRSLLFDSGRTGIGKDCSLFYLWPKARSQILKEGDCHNSRDQCSCPNVDWLSVCPTQTFPHGAGQPSPGHPRNASPFPEVSMPAALKDKNSQSAGLESRLLCSGNSSLLFMFLHILVSHSPSVLKASKINKESKSSGEKTKNYPSVR